MNITDITKTTLKEVWETLKTISEECDVEITGTELIGLIPEGILIESAREWGVSGTRDEMVDFVINKMNFNDLTPFDYNKKILERLL